MAATTIEENEQLTRDHFDRVWNHGEFDTAILVDDYRVHPHLGGHETHTLTEFQAFVAQARESMSDIRKESPSLPLFEPSERR